MKLVFPLTANSTLSPGGYAEGCNYSHPPQAGKDYGGAWALPSTVGGGEGKGIFIGFLSWWDEAAKRQWYNDYSKMSYKAYGWRIDGLRRMASLGVESYCASMQENNMEWLEWNERLGFPQGGVKRQVPVMTEDSFDPTTLHPEAFSSNSQYQYYQGVDQEYASVD